MGSGIEAEVGPSFVRSFFREVDLRFDDGASELLIVPISGFFKEIYYTL